jgi:hypothetical protein
MLAMSEAELEPKMRKSNQQPAIQLGIFLRKPTFSEKPG